MFFLEVLISTLVYVEISALISKCIVLDLHVNVQQRSNLLKSDDNNGNSWSSHLRASMTWK